MKLDKKSATHKYSKYAITSIDGAKSDGTGIASYGKTITVKLDNYINNPLYIKASCSKHGDYEYKLATNNDQNPTTLSFEMKDGFLIKENQITKL